MVKIGINGLGRIGRLVVRAALKASDVELCFVNTPSKPEQVAHLIKYDSIHGAADFECSYNNGFINIDNKQIPIFSERKPADIPTYKYDIDVMLECSGKFNKRAESIAHIKAGAKKIVISAPCEDADCTIVLGVNENILKNEHKMISLGSCTTNALAPIAKIINDNFGIINGYVTTIHAYTSDQNLVDNSHNDFRRARSANLSIVPTKTGAAQALKLVLPELEGKIQGSAVRVPVANVSMLDMVFNLEKAATKDAINSVIEFASKNNMHNILAVAKAELVSSDFNHSTYSSIFDPFETTMIGNNMVRLVAWYDNEWAFANRLVDITRLLV